MKTRSSNAKENGQYKGASSFDMRVRSVAHRTKSDKSIRGVSGLKSQILACWSLGGSTMRLQKLVVGPTRRLHVAQTLRLACNTT